MTKIDIAAKAELLRVLPAVILAEYAKRSELLPNLMTTLHDASNLVPGGLVRLTVTEEQTLLDDSAVEYLCSLSRPDGMIGPEKSSVRLSYPSIKSTSALPIRTHFINLRLRRRNGLQSERPLPPKTF
jgi:hypothetical protein